MPRNSERRGFASMDPEERRQIARRGGQSTQSSRPGRAIMIMKKMTMMKMMMTTKNTWAAIHAGDLVAGQKVPSKIHRAGIVLREGDLDQWILNNADGYPHGRTGF